MAGVLLLSALFKIDSWWAKKKEVSAETIEYPSETRKLRFDVSSRRARPVVYPDAAVVGTALEFHPEALFFVVQLAGRERAYAIAHLHYAELVLDGVAGKRALITYCGLTGSAVAFEDSEEGDVAGIEDSHLLLHSNLVLKDKVTGSLWRQITGECVQGKRLGSVLKTIPGRLERWSSLSTRRNEVDIVMLDDAKASALKVAATMGEELDSSGLLRTDLPSLGTSVVDTRLPLMQLVLGVQVSGRAIAVRVGPDEGNADKRVTLGDGVNLIVRRGVPFLVTQAGRGREVVSTPSFWFAWSQLHPGTEIWDAGR